METKSLVDTKNIAPVMIKSKINGYSIILNCSPILFTIFVL